MASGWGCQFLGKNGVNKGIDMAANRGKSSADMTAGEREQAQKAKKRSDNPLGER